MNKKKIFEKIVEQEESYIEKLQQSLQQYKSAAHLEDDDTMDRHDMSQANEAKDMQMRLRLQLDKANSDLNEFKKVAGEDYDSVEKGALVTTAKAYFFVGVSLHTINIDGKDVFGVSAESPAFKTMYGKAKGDEFKLGPNSYTIKNIS